MVSEKLRREVELIGSLPTTIPSGFQRRVKEAGNHKLATGLEIVSSVGV
jgi:hypothetical protein